VLSVEVRDPLPLGFIDLREPCSPNRARATRINCRQRRPSLTSGPHQDRNGQACAHVRSLRRGATEESRRAVTSAPPPRWPLRTRLRRLKRRARGARLQPQLWAFNGPVPYKVSVTLARPEPRAREIRPSKGTITDQWSRDPLDESGRHRCPRFQRITDQQLEGRPDRVPMSPTDVKKTGGI
jgi:hypothetical protein